MIKPKSFAVNLTGGNQSGDRVANDFYATTPECVTSLLAVEEQYLKGMKIYEPCCGDGAISDLMINAGYEVYSADLVDRGYGDTGIDFLTVESTDCQAIVTNPPFNLSEKFITHALEVLKVDYLALLLKSQYWHSKRRMALFEKYPPAAVYAMTWRPDFSGKGSPTMECQWTIWRASEYPITEFRPIPKR